MVAGLRLNSPPSSASGLICLSSRAHVVGGQNASLFRRLQERSAGGLGIGLVVQGRKAREPGHALQVGRFERFRPSVHQPLGRALGIANGLPTATIHPHEDWFKDVGHRLFQLGRDADHAHQQDARHNLT
jgi:hypothetical protein